MRACVWIPDELADTVKSDIPDVNMSRVLQEGLRALLGCRHERLACAACGQERSQGEIEDVALGRFYSDFLWELATLVDRGGTAEGAARIAKDVAGRYRVKLASTLSLPRPSRAARQASKVKEFPAGGRGATRGRRQATG